MNILIVDDEPDVELLVRQKFRKQIRQKEMALSFAFDGLQALERLNEDQDIDIVLTDINMPKMDGLTLLSRIQELDRSLKVVVVSAYGDLSNIRTAMNRGAFDFIVKPIDFTDLQVTLDKTRKELELLREGLKLQKQFAAIQRELEIASQIQLSALPSVFPAFPDRTDFDLYAAMLPAQEVGGDFYDFFMIDEDRLAFAIGDVSGKGIAAALFMAVTRTLLRATALRGVNPAECIQRVNRVLHPESMRHLFVTVIYGILDTRSGEVAFTNAGHNLPYVIRKGGDVEQLPRQKNVGVCLMKDFAFKEDSVLLNPGDQFFLFTDGVTEAVASDDQQFETERLEKCLSEVVTRAPSQLIRNVLHAVVEFTGEAPQADDITMVAIQFRGPDSGPLEAVEEPLQVQSEAPSDQP